MRSFNQVTLMGNMTRDPELRTTPNGQSVCTFSLALNRSYKANDEWKEATDYADIVTWGPLAERVDKFCHKGSSVLVNGRLQSSKWEKDGVTRQKVEVVAQDVTFLNIKEKTEDQSAKPDVLPTDEEMEKPIDLSEIPL